MLASAARSRFVRKASGDNDDDTVVDDEEEMVVEEAVLLLLSLALARAMSYRSVSSAGGALLLL